MSFFSFQDIICAVTGIMIIIIIVITLELAERVQGDPGTPQALPASEELLASLEQDKEKRDALKRQVTDLSNQLEEKSEQGMLTAEDVTKLGNQVNNLEERLQEQAKQLTDKKNRRATLVANVKNVEDALGKARINVRTAEKKLDLAGAPKVGFLGKQPAETPLLVDCSAKQIIVGRRHAKSQQTEVINRFGDTVGFLAWAKGRDPGSEYFVFLVRPDGLEVFRKLQATLKARTRFKLGWEPWADEKGPLFPSP